ncbi:hypothetical protein HDU96_010637 [Phlyctochytrium bullatum]|nr:hypothetical protein HDU96_010637 [Phlyctochytrium bullatum]
MARGNRQGAADPVPPSSTGGVGAQGAGWFAKTKNIKPVVEEGGLSIVERVFFKSAPGRPQVIMGIILRLRPPPQVKELKVARIIDLLRIAQAKHYRLASSIDPETMIARPMATNAKDLPCNYRFVVRTHRDIWKEVYEEEINTNFDVNDPSKPLWRNVIILPPNLMPADSDPVFQQATPLPPTFATSPSPVVKITPVATEDEDPKGKSPAIASAQRVEANGEVAGLGLPSNTLFGKANSIGESTHGPSDPDLIPGEEYFEIMFTFHHCLGDGLSMFAFARTFLECANAEHLNASDLQLEKIPVVTTPPPLIDNLLDPWFFEVVPVIGEMAIRSLLKKGRRFKGRKAVSEPQPKAERPTAVVRKNKNGGSRSPSPAPGVLSPSLTSSAPNSPPSESVYLIPGNGAGAGPSTSPQSTPPSIPKPLSLAYTRVRFLWFDSEFISALRRKAKSEGTTIAAVLVVASLAAVRTSFATLPKYAKKPLPSHQGWVVTNSVRHMLPMSNLIKGGDREVDEGLKMFGGYAGSVTNSSLLLEDTSDVWERCRVVRKSIARCFRDSIQRMKLMNYCYRHPRLWRMIEKKVDLAKLSRSYSVEVANLGAWEYPAAPPFAPPEDERVRLDHFGGVVNSSFDGVRGLFTVGVITLGGNMSVAVGYDMGSVHEEDANVFLNAFYEGLRRLKDSEGKVTVSQIRK